MSDYTLFTRFNMYNVDRFEISDKKFTFNSDFTPSF